MISDLLWKHVIEDLVEDFLLFFFPEAAELFDYSKGVEYLDRQLEQLVVPDAGSSSLRIADKLVKVFIKGEGERWILVHIEVQGYADSDFARRMFQYYYRILDRHQREITALAILTDPRPAYRPKVYSRIFLGTRLEYEFNIYKVREQEIAQLEASINPFAQVVLAVRVLLERKVYEDRGLLELGYGLARGLFSKEFDSEKVRKLMNFIKGLLYFENPELMRKFEERTAELSKNNKAMGVEEFLLEQAQLRGIEKGKAEGIEKGKAEGIEKGKAEGIEKGKAEGMEKGIEQGKSSGMEEGIAYTKNITARRMLKKGMPEAEIADLLDLSIEKVRGLSASEE